VNKEVQLQLLVVDFVNIFVFMLLVLFFYCRVVVFRGMKTSVSNRFS